MNHPLVTVVVPTKNSEKTLGECLNSIKNQTYPAIQLIVVDNFSSDQTPEIGQRLADAFYSKGPERSAQRNFAVEQSAGEYVCIIDSDMTLDSTVIEECVNEMQKDPKTRGVIIPEESFGDGFWAQCKKLERSFYLGVPYMEAARFFYKRDFISLGGYNLNMVSGEDWDLSQRIESLGLLSRTKAFIHHNEGRISLLKTVQKKFYYAKLFASYKNTSDNHSKISQQTSIIGRYTLFLSKPKKLFRNPILGVGMLFMKTCEFGFGGLGYIISKAAVK